MAGAIWWRIAVRNLWRNPGRTALAGGGLAFSFAAAVTMVAVSDGMSREMVVTRYGGALEADPDSRRRLPPGPPDLDDDRRRRRNGPDPTAGRPAREAGRGRRRTAGLGRRPAQSRRSDRGGGTPRRLPEAEHGVSRFLDGMSAGRAPTPGTREIALGAETARRLHASPGDTIVVVAPAADGSLGNDLYTVSGVWQSGLAELDAGLAVLPLDALQRLLALGPDRIHEVAIALGDPWSAAAIARSLDSLPRLGR
ncbi:MAG: ABC transporter permease [Gemmatimonadales bacterium]